MNNPTSAGSNQQWIIWRCWLGPYDAWWLWRYFCCSLYWL